MNHNSRTSNVMKNVIGGVGGQIFTTFLSFACRTVFIQLLGSTYLGVSGLFTNILQMLSLSELGISTAIVYAMYKPIAQGDEKKIAQYMNFYKTAYRVIALIVGLIGISLVPFLDFFISETPDIPENLGFIYILVLFNTVVSYLYCFKGSMLTADQRNYIVIIIKNIFAVIQNISQILILMWTKSFVLYLIVQIVTTLLANLVQAVYVDRHYPFLKKYEKEKISKKERNALFRNVQGMMLHKVGGFVLNGTDNLVISKFIGVVAVGIYSNYLMIINIIKSYLTQITGSVTASVGNLIASETKEKVNEVFNAMQLVYFWIYSFCFICFWILFQPFIEFWIGEEYLLSKSVLLVVLINFYLNGYQDCINNFVNATGLFWETRYKPIIECVINLTISVLLASKMGLSGVFIGTLVSFLCTFWINPIYLYKKYFEGNVLPYFLRFIGYFFLMIALAFGMDYLLSGFGLGKGIFELLMRIVACLIVPNLLYVILFHNASGFMYCKRMFLGVIKKFKK